MDKFGDYIRLILKGMHVSDIRKKELEEEFRDHLEMTKSELVKAGYSEEQAEAEAIQRFGEAREIKNRFKSVFTPYRILKDIIVEKKVLKESLQWAVAILGAVIVSFSVRSYAFAQTEVKQMSMQNTLFEGQRLIEYKIDYYFSAPKRGDIVIINREAEKGALNTLVANAKDFVDAFYKKGEDDQKRLIKRVIGVPGDTIDLKDGKVYINGKYYAEPYVKGPTYPHRVEFPLKVPENQYFVMGDNRENSMDSRDLGLISIDNIEGKAIFRTWPLDKFGGIYN